MMNSSQDVWQKTFEIRTSVITNHVFLGRDINELATYISLAIFNEGLTEEMRCIIEWNAYHYAQSQDDEGIAMEAGCQQQGEDEQYLSSGVLLYGPAITT